MTSLPPNTLLMLCLIAATLLGAGIGACLWHLRSAARSRRALASVRRAAEAERDALDTLLREERDVAAMKHAEVRAALESARERAERERTRHDTLALHAREQGRRIDALEAEIIAYETHPPVHRQGDPDDATARPADTSPARPLAGTRDEDDLPVLNRRVRDGSGAPALRQTSRVVSRSASGLASSPSIAGALAGASVVPEPAFPMEGDLDIPALSESELPDAEDDRALGLLDTRNLFPDVDE